MVKMASVCFVEIQRRKKCNPCCNMIWGFAFDNTMSGKLLQSQERATRDIHVEIQEVK